MNRDTVAQIVARGYGGSLSPELGTPGDYPTDVVDYRIADAILAALDRPAPVEMGEDVEMLLLAAVSQHTTAGFKDHMAIARTAYRLGARRLAHSAPKDAGVEA